MRVEEIMTRDVSFCSPGTNAAVATEIMWIRNCGSLPAVDDIVLRTGSLSKDLLKTMKAICAPELASYCSLIWTQRENNESNDANQRTEHRRTSLGRSVSTLHEGPVASKAKDARTIPRRRPGQPC